MKEICTTGIAIYGGSFDPVHKGHTAVIGHLSKEFDKVIVVPSFISPFKRDNQAATAPDRMEMLRLALSEQKIKAEVSDFEIKKGGVSYTIDTVKNFCKKDCDVYVVIGAENLASLSLWKDFEELKKLVTFYVISRPEYFEEQCNALEGVRLRFSTLAAPDVSSSLAKTALAFFGASPLFAASRLNEYLPQKVQKFIRKRGLYNQYTPQTRGLNAFKLKPERIEHTFFTAKYAIKLAKIHGEDVDKAIIAAILHDVGKEATAEMLEEFGVPMPVLPPMPPSCRHGYIGAEIAKTYFGIEDEDILNAIRYHTTCRPQMNRLEKIIALADYLEESREFSPKLPEIRSLSEKNLDAAMCEMLKALLEHLKSSGKEIFDLTQAALGFYENN